VGDEFFERERENCFKGLTERKMGEKTSVAFRKKDECPTTKLELPDLHKLTNSGHTCSWCLFLLSVVWQRRTIRAISSDLNDCQQVVIHTCANFNTYVDCIQ